MTEVWLPVPGYDTTYEVSNLARVRKCYADGRVKSLSIFKFSNGYSGVSLNRTPCGLHRLVCAAFHGPRPSLSHEVAHNNGIKSDNLPANLRWATRSENNRDQDLHGTRVRKLGVANHQTPFTNEDVRTIVELSRRGVGPVALGRRYGVTHNSIRQITTGKTWSHLTGIGRN